MNREKMITAIFRELSETQKDGGSLMDAASAQAHATAAHWANTPLGKLVGVV